MEWLVFPSLAACQAAIATINANIKFPAGGVTQTWAVPAVLADGTSYAIPQPGSQYMTGVSGYTVSAAPAFPVKQGTPT